METSELNFHEKLEGGKIKCKICDKVYASITSFGNHRRKIHSIATKKRKVGCPIGFKECETFANYLELHDHLQEMHGIKCKPRVLEFPTFEDFKNWKDDYEQKAAVRFIRTRGGKERKQLVYNCHRSGQSVILDEENRKRALKSKVLTKIGATCPAKILVKKSDSGEVEMTAYLDHVHAGDNSNREDNNVVQRFSKKLVDRVISDLKQGHSTEYILANIEAEKGKIWFGGDMFLSTKHIYDIRKRKLPRIIDRHDVETVEIDHCPEPEPVSKYPEPESEPLEPVPLEWSSDSNRLKKQKQICLRVKQNLIDTVERVADQAESAAELKKVTEIMRNFTKELDLGVVGSQRETKKKQVKLGKRATSSRTVGPRIKKKRWIRVLPCSECSRPTHETNIESCSHCRANYHMFCDHVCAYSRLGL